jgi:hypothetical protein
MSALANSINDPEARNNTKRGRLERVPNANAS